MIRVYLDVPFTRRKTYHMAVDESGEALWKTRTIEPMLEWLCSREIGDYIICTESLGDYRLIPIEIDKKDK